MRTILDSLVTRIENIQALMVEIEEAKAMTDSIAEMVLANDGTLDEINAPLSDNNPSSLSNLSRNLMVADAAYN